MYIQDYTRLYEHEVPNVDDFEYSTYSYDIPSIFHSFRWWNQTDQLRIRVI